MNFFFFFRKLIDDSSEEKLCNYAPKEIKSM